MSTFERLAAALADRYRIEREIGAGGMATVYLAEDLKHRRRVALKVLKPELAAVLGADRFVQEITTTAALQHPHILPLYDSGEADGFLFYVMPFIDGETLRSKLDRETQLGIDEAVRIATNVADALDYAHRHGVIHRDIKPENILLHEGRPMVADFGIALAVSAAAGGRMTETGLSLGTPHYMSPEQATAEKEISARSDIYSLASVLYEMLTGNPPHTGASAQQIIMKIITEEPADVTSLRKSVPSNVAAAVAQGLEKLPADRFESAKAFANALADSRFTVAGRPAAVLAARDSVWKNRFYAAALVALVLGGLAAMSQASGRTAATDARPMHLVLPLPDGDRIAALNDDRLRNADRPSRTAFTFSPDGTSLVYSGERGDQRQLFLMPLSGRTSTPIAGTEGGESPFFSADGLSIGFWAGGRLRRVLLAGGPVTDITTISRITGASWGADDRIVVGVWNTGLIVVAAAGGAVDTLAEPHAVHPQWLPGQRAILFTKDMRLDNGKAHIEVLSLKNNERAIVMDQAEDARYVTTGHIIFGRDGTMMAAPFDAGRLEVTAPPMVVLDDVMQARNGMNVQVRNGAMQVAVSPAGHIAWLAGGVTPDRVSTLAWLDRQGRRTPITSAGEGAFFRAQLSPDETHFAVFAFGRTPRVVVVDIARQSSVTIPTAEGPTLQWSADGKRILHSGAIGDSSGTVWSMADGRRPAEPLPGSKLVRGAPVFWSRDSLELFLLLEDDLVGYRPADAATRVVADLPKGLDFPTLSPDGKWLAYAVVEPGSDETDVFVQPWPALDRRWKVSTAGGSAPAWTRNGRELVYLDFVDGDTIPGTARVMAVDIGAGADLAPGAPHELFTSVFGTSTPIKGWDVTRDGSRFLVVVGRTPMSPPGDIHVIVNWFTDLRRLTGEATRK